MLLWACERAGYEPEDLAGRLRQLAGWISGEKQPTMRQLEKFARLTHTPIGFLFLPEPPDEPLPVPDFRTVSGSRGERPSPDLLDTVYAMQRRQSWLREALIEDEADPLPFVGSARLSDPPDAVGREMRRMVGLGDGWAAQVGTWKAAVGTLRRAIERLGIMAVINGVVGNNTSRALHVDEFRGFALSDPYAPLIFVNGADARAAQMFTLAHELAHIWLGAGGLTGFEGLFPGGHEVEEWCNRAAAEFLVPARDLQGRWAEAKQGASPFETLARWFKVSPIVAARRALDLGWIDREAFLEFYEDYSDRDRSKGDSLRGGEFYNTQNQRVGELFYTHVLHAAMEGRVGFKEAYDLTGLKGSTFLEYARRLEIEPR